VTEPRLTVVGHPLVQHKLSYLRDKDTPTVHFRKLANEITLLLTYEATKDMATESTEIETPLERTTAQRIDGVLSLVSSARVGFVGMYRDEETLEPVQYYLKLPDDLAERDAIVLDPMLATGHSSCAAVGAVKEAGAQSVTLVCIVAAPPGIEEVHRQHPDVHIVCAAVDRGLNERGFIVPGLGDAGDRLYGTK
jgi:uracil phosphoribosyltransferase